MRLLGSSVGWGFQFQHPGFVFSLLLIIFVIALNMLGLFDFGSGIQTRAGSIKVANGTAGAFLSGVLATALATPCTGPFMGSAIAAALTMSSIMTLIVFSFLGAGLALPYMILCWYPAWRRFLPRPGAWMDILKQVLALPLFMTVIWLIWILDFQIGIAGVSRVIVSLAIVAAACWGFGRLCTPASSRLRQRGVTFGALVAFIIAVLVGTPWSGYVADSSIAAASSSAAVWEKFSPERLTALRASGTPVVVDFTAAWCVVCQVNERRVFGSADIVEPLIQDGVVFLKADWTKEDPDISAELARHGAVGIPLVLVYGRKGKSAIFTSLIEPQMFLREAREVIGAGRS
jgi:thiol:disulfide interchange protein DsbD